MLVIGLTGGIGTGKSYVAHVLKNMGACLVNADLLGHELYEPDRQGWSQVTSAFGEDVLGDDRRIDRSKLGEIVFNDSASLEQLNSIMHPLIFRLAEKRIEDLSRDGASVVVLEAALLIEADWVSLVDEIWVTVSNEDDVVNRIKERNGLSEDAIRARMSAQMSQVERVLHADIVIENGESLADLDIQIQDLWRKRVLD